MADVSITIHGQKYTVRCDDGEEARVENLAVYFNYHVERLAAELGHVAESRLLILAGITVCEELFTAREKTSPVTDELAADILSLATRLEQCAITLEGNGGKTDKPS